MRRLLTIALLSVSAIHLASLPVVSSAPSGTETCDERSLPPITRWSGEASAPDLPERIACASPPSDLRYGSYVRSGPLTEPGSYTLRTADGSGIRTYEYARRQAATLQLHVRDAGGRDQSALLDGLRVGDLVEWWQTDDCFVRYLICGAPVVDDATRTFPVRWMTYAYSGCRGAILADRPARFRVGDRPHLGGYSLTFPIRHGPFHLVPERWRGALEPTELADPISYTREYPWRTEDLAVARTFPFWREPKLPDGWGFAAAWKYAGGDWGEDLRGRDDQGREVTGYTAYWDPGIDIDGRYMLEHGTPIIAAPNIRDPYLHIVTETRVIAGRAAQIRYSPIGPNHSLAFSPSISVYDPATGVRYLLRLSGKELRAPGFAAAIALIQSLFEPPNPP